jgi:phage gpG-like protein
MYDVRLEGGDEVQAWLNKLPERMFDSAKVAIGTAVFNTQAEVTKRLQGNPMQSRTGALARSILPEVKGEKLDNLVGRIYSTSIYAPIHEFGGPIKPIDKYLGVPGGPYLNIPMPANLTPAGVMRMNAKQVFDLGGYVAKTRTGKYGVFLKDQMMFILSKGVTIKPQLGMIKAAEGQIPVLLTRLNDLLQESLQ